jgi:hypothetical protein
MLTLYCSQLLYELEQESREARQPRYHLAAEIAQRSRARRSPVALLLASLLR